LDGGVRSIPGKYLNFGKKHMKPDSHIESDVVVKPKWEQSLHAESTGVEVTEDVVRTTVHTGTYAGFSDHITLPPSVSLGAVKADIAAALKRRARVDAQKISIDVQGSDVTLTGTAHS
jgi:hypothetical protein